MSAMRTIEGPDGKSSGNGRIPRWMVVGLGLIAWLIALPLVHGVLPWVLSSLTIRYGWTRGRPGIWNLLGLLPAAIGAAGLIWVLALGLARIRELPERMQGFGSPYLMTRGPYAFTRNPMYVGELALWFGWTILFGSAALLLALVTLLIAMVLVVPREERRLEERFGEAYREYKTTVPRWVGRRRPKSGPTNEAEEAGAGDGPSLLC